MEKLDALVVGGGISGLNIAWHLKNQHKTFKLFNSKSIPSSTMVAAGTWNPINFKKLSPTWIIADFLQAMMSQYGEIEEELNIACIDLIKIKKILSDEEHQFWKSKLQEGKLEEYIAKSFEEFKGKKLGEIKQGGRINLEVLMPALWDYFAKHQQLIVQDFNYEALSFEKGRWVYKDQFSVENVFFAEGIHVNKNPFFSWLPLKPVNGDVLTLYVPDLKIDYLLKKNIFIYPLGEGYFQVGATYNWDELTWEASEKAKNELLEKFEQIIEYPYKVVSQKAGIRPSSLDRRPIIGEHPTKSGLWLMNGMGAKGVLLSPLVSKWLLEGCYQKQTIAPEINLHKWVKKAF